MTSRKIKRFQDLFLTFECAPWYRNIGMPCEVTKGIHVILCCFATLQYELSDLEANRPELFGHVLENFVATNSNS